MKHAALQVMNLRSFYAAFASPVPLATTTTTKLSPLHPAPSSSPGGAPSPTFLSGLLTPRSVGGKYVTDATVQGFTAQAPVDFSKALSLSYSLSNLEALINNTLQFLQGKSMYSSLDLRQAYMAMRINEESQPLTTVVNYIKFLSLVSSG